MSPKNTPEEILVSQIKNTTLLKILAPFMLVVLGATGYGTTVVRSEVARSSPTEGFASRADVQALSRDISRLNNAVQLLTARIDRLNDHN